MDESVDSCRIGDCSVANELTRNKIYRSRPIEKSFPTYLPIVAYLSVASVKMKIKRSNAQRKVEGCMRWEKGRQNGNGV